MLVSHPVPGKVHGIIQSIYPDHITGASCAGKLSRLVLQLLHVVPSIPACCGATATDIIALVATVQCSLSGLVLQHMHVVVVPSIPIPRPCLRHVNARHRSHG